MTELGLFFIGLATLAIGALIGSVGVGGVLLAPMLTKAAGFGIKDAIAIAMASFIATGAMAGFLSRSSHGSLRGRWPLILATAPGALLGAFALAAASEWLATLVLAAFVGATGARILLLPPDHFKGGGERRGGDIPIGLAVGFASAMTGTGGPLVLIPTLVWRGAPVLTAIALGQIVQLPIALVATLGNHLNGGVDLRSSAVIGALLVPGVILGRWLAEQVRLSTFSRVVAFLLILVGVYLAADAVGWPSRSAAGVSANLKMNGVA